MKDRVDRDDVLARLGARLLPRGGEGARAQCPGADIVAAYLDQSLDAAERARCEEHFAACARCQGALAGFARIESEAPATQPAPLRVEGWRWRFSWQWMAPAAAVLAAGVLWTLLRPVVAPMVPPMPEAPAKSQQTEVAADRSLTPVEREADKTAGQFDRVVPPPPAGAAASKLARAQEESKEAAANEVEARAKREAPAPAATVVAQNIPAEQPKDIRAEPPAMRKAADAAKPAAAPQPAAAPAPAAPPSAERAAVEAQSKQVRVDATRLVPAAGAAAAFTMVVSPTPDVVWRVGPAGSIELSTDAGRTWQKLASGVTAGLLAGSAPSETTCWVVGQRGTVLRTTDGRMWETVSPPAIVDLVSVLARDALAASVLAADGRRFATTDGGRTWRAP